MLFSPTHIMAVAVEERAALLASRYSILALDRWNISRIQCWVFVAIDLWIAQLPRGSFRWVEATPSIGHGLIRFKVYIHTCTNTNISPHPTRARKNLALFISLWTELKTPAGLGKLLRSCLTSRCFLEIPTPTWLGTSPTASGCPISTRSLYRSSPTRRRGEN